MLALCYVQNYLSHLFHIFEFWKERYLLAEVKVFPPSQKCFPPCAVKVKVLACKGEWWQPEGGSASVSHNSMVEWSMVHGGPSSSWEPTAPIIGAPRASMPASLLLHSIICHSESNWGLRGNQSLYNQGSRLLIERLFLVHSLTCPIIILRVIEDCFKRNHFVAIFSAARLVSHPRLGWSAWLLLIRFALETTISRWPHLSSSYF